MHVAPLVDRERRPLLGVDGDVDVLDRRRPARVAEHAVVARDVDEPADPLVVDRLRRRHERRRARAEPRRARRQLAQELARVELARGDARRRQRRRRRLSCASGCASVTQPAASASQRARRTRTTRAPTRHGADLPDGACTR